MVRAVISLAVVTAVVAFAAASSAQASCSGYFRCYGQVDFVPSGSYTGGLAYITATRLSSGSSHFATAELWVCGPNIWGDCNTWVESGLTVGIRQNSSATALTGFWAEQPGGGCAGGMYAEHYPASLSSASLGAAYATKISFNGGFRFAVYRNGSFIDNSVACFDVPVARMFAGTETDDTSSKSTGSATNLQKRNSDNATWSYNWGGSTLFQQGIGWVQWSSQYASANYGTNN